MSLLLQVTGEQGSTISRKKRVQSFLFAEFLDYSSDYEKRDKDRSSIQQQHQQKMETNYSEYQISQDEKDPPLPPHQHQHQHQPQPHRHSFRRLYNTSLASIAAIPAWKKLATGMAAVATMTMAGLITMPNTDLPHYRVAFIGNSMQYYNDFPRFLETLANGHLEQDCCLHSDASFNTILTWGSGMYQIWHTGVARMETTVFDDDATSTYEKFYSESDTTQTTNRKVMYDMGACTVEQLLFGYDADLAARVEENAANNDDTDGSVDDNIDQQLNDDALTYNDGKNPCLQDSSYYFYKQDQYNANGGAPQFDFVVMNDRTRDPARRETRNASLQVLEDVYVPWLQELEATPVFIVTYGYDTPYRDMSGLVDVPTFTSLTYQGYKEYAELVSEHLEPEHAARLAPVGLAFLMVWEENYTLWQKLFHIDRIHASPHGTFLQGCVVHHTLFGRLPPKRVVLRNDMSSLWDNARRMQPRKHRRLPMPTLQEAEYLYHIAERVTVRKQVPKSFIAYKNNEASDYVPNDGEYADNDIY